MRIMSLVVMFTVAVMWSGRMMMFYESSTAFRGSVIIIYVPTYHYYFMIVHTM